jgi:hypothetical protein
MSTSKRTVAPPVPSAVWLTVKFTGSIDNISRRRFANRLSSFLAGTSIRPVVSTRLIGLHHPRGFAPFEIALITAWLSAQPDVKSHDFMPPVPTVLKKGSLHG